MSEIKSKKDIRDAIKELREVAPSVASLLLVDFLENHVADIEDCLLDYEGYEDEYEDDEDYDDGFYDDEYEDDDDDFGEEDFSY